MIVSIIVCTRNRSGSLMTTLRSIAETNVPEDLSAELLVVDNGSTDDTESVVRECESQNLAIRYIYEGQAGQCFARNRGLREASGEVILFTDDDVRVPVDWIEGMCRPILTGSADANAGAVVFPPHLEEVLSKEPFCRYRSWFASTEAIDMHRPDRFVGANMAFAKQPVLEMGGFDTNLGPGALGFADETLLSRKLIAAGYRVRGVPGIRVVHHFDPSRATIDSLIKTAKSMGRSEAYMKHSLGKGDGRRVLALAWEMAMTLELWYRRAARVLLRRSTASALSNEINRTVHVNFCRQIRMERKRNRASGG